MASITEKARRIGRRGLVVLSVTATMAISGVAFASWTLTGEGSGSANAANAADLSAVAVTIEGALYPGVTSNATLTVTNPNPFPVSITEVNFSGAVVVTDTPTGCTTFEDHAVAFVDSFTVEFFVPANNEPTSFELTNAVSMGSGSNDECQGQTFTRPFTLVAGSTVNP